MPIRSTAWVVNGKAYADLDEAQRQELRLLIIESVPSEVKDYGVIISRIVAQKLKVVEILSIRDKRPRSDKGKNHAKRNQVMAVSLEETK